MVEKKNHKKTNKNKVNKQKLKKKNPISTLAKVLQCYKC